MDITEYTVAAVMAAVWIIIEIIKKIVGENSKVRSYFPLVAALLGVVFVFWINGAIDFTLFLQGIASGFAATGLNEGINAVLRDDEEDW